MRGLYNGTRAKDMNLKDYITFIKEQSERDDAILLRKCKDYNDENDVFSNFDIARLIGIDPRRAILWEMAKKISRVGNLLDREPSNESVSDSMSDIANYTVIFRGLVKEKEPRTE